MTSEYRQYLAPAKTVEVQGVSYTFNRDVYEVLLQVTRRDVMVLACYLEDDENAAVVTTVQGTDAVVRVQTTWELREQVDGMLAALDEEVPHLHLASNAEEPANGS